MSDDKINVAMTKPEIAAMRSMLEVALKSLGRQAVNIFQVLDSKLANAERVNGAPVVDAGEQPVASEKPKGVNGVAPHIVGNKKVAKGLPQGRAKSPR